MLIVRLAPPVVFPLHGKRRVAGRAPAAAVALAAVPVAVEDAAIEALARAARDVRAAEAVVVVIIVVVVVVVAVVVVAQCTDVAVPGGDDHVRPGQLEEQLGAPYKLRVDVPSRDVSRAGGHDGRGDGAVACRGSERRPEGKDRRRRRAAEAISMEANL